MGVMKMEWLVLFLVGLISGVLGSLVGLGGGIIIVPTLLFLGTYTNWISGISPHIAVGTSLLVIIFTGLSSTLTYMKYKSVDYHSGLIFILGSTPGAILGALVNNDLNTDSFYLYFGIFIIFMSFVLMIKTKLKPIRLTHGKRIHRAYVDEYGYTNSYSFNPIIAFLITFFVGFLAGLFGIGGGALMVPAMILLFGFPAHIAVATSMLMIFVSSIVSSITHIALGHINWAVGIALIPGAWIGGNLGSKLNKKLKGDTVVIILRIILVIMGIRLILQA